MSLGFDISDNNTIEDWVELGRTVDFLYIKLNQGANPSYAFGPKYWDAAWAQRIPAGAYHFAVYSEDPAASGLAFAQACEAVGALHATQWNLIPAVDMETMDAANATGWIQAFEEAFRNATSYTGDLLIYASLSTFTSGQIVMQPNWRSWVAEWNSQPGNCAWAGASIHQYSDSYGAGVWSGFDADWAIATLDSLQIVD